MQVEDIVQKDLKRAFLGYDIQQVDAFLDEIIEELRRSKEENDLMVLRIEALLERLDALEEE
ncbi:MAG: DivIVA domain-containing protein [Bacillota bacterium]